MSTFWSLWIVILTIVCIGGITWILFANRKVNRKPGETTGHVYDGIEELDNPLPAWWFQLFVATLIFAVVYFLVYPGMGNFQGFLGWSSDKQWQEEVAIAEAKVEQALAPFKDKSISELSQNPDATIIGERLFANHCSVCHGTDAKGSFGFPDLTDNDWLYGDSEDAMLISIKQGRQAMMPAWGSILKEEQLLSVSEMLKENNLEHPEGSVVYTQFCASCHGQKAEGNTLLGAPALNDDIWLYGGELSQIRHSIQKGRQGVMPAHKDILSDIKLKLVTSYVYSFK